MPLEPENFVSLWPALQEKLSDYLGQEIDWKEYPSGRVYELFNLELPTSQVHNALHDVYSLAATIQHLEAEGIRILEEVGNISKKCKAA
ncbi:MAG: hypothetical protein OXR68_07465 [Alphaproteobacteria bacterium]|nr:hypothetical protein [Alphaproteobacteria bacterium]MDD9920441.1 hypothetical protein [Alphaproteobacteria bacterium]